MHPEDKDYHLYLEFIARHVHTGFRDIRAEDPLVKALEEMNARTNQFFYAGDLLQIQVIFTSKRSMDMMGIEPAVLTPLHFFQTTHPDDIKRLTLGRAQLLKMAHDLFREEQGASLLSTTFRIQNAEGRYVHMLTQLYLFYSEIPYKTVFVLKVHTNIDWYSKLGHGYHYYLGRDLSHFRYPDDDLLMIGNLLSDREFEIVKLVGTGLSSEQIAEKLFLSTHTVNTHRKNILRKTGKANISELIYELMENGVL